MFIRDVVSWFFMVNVDVYTALTGHELVRYIVDGRDRYGVQRTFSGDFDPAAEFIRGELRAGSRLERVTVSNGGRHPIHYETMPVNKFLERGVGPVDRLIVLGWERAERRV